ncbi:MAG: hypothetical protein AMXMBFR13_36490 [Phycisphaerae bacterium]
MGCGLAGPARGAERPAVYGIEELHRLDLLPAFRTSTRVASMSSYDRTGGNNDGFSGEHSFVRKEDGGLVLADLKGPGIIYRIWTPTPTDDILEFYFDGEATPRVRLPFRELFTGTKPPFVKPIVGSGAGGYFSYVPLPYEKSCKVLIRAERVQFYQINFAAYPPSMPVASFDPKPSPAYLVHQQKAAEVLSSRGGDLTAFNTPDESHVKTNSFSATLIPGQAATIYKSDRPGRIVGLRIGPAAALASKERDLLLRITWDGDPQPAVLCPVGDFFGYAWGKPATTSCLLGTADDMNYCYLPMPFDRSAQIELISAASSGSRGPIKGEVLVADEPRRDYEGKLYAVWRRENPTTKGQPFTFVETAGRGHLVGCILQAQGTESGHTYFFEGDDQTAIDGELVIHGTGSEDFFNGGWYDVPERWNEAISLPLSGCLTYARHLGRTGGYRFMIADAYAFEKSLLHTIEHAPTGNDLLTDYVAVSYLYCEKPPTYDIPMPTVKDRQVIDFDRIVFASWWNPPINGFCFDKCTLTKKAAKFDGKDQRYLSMRSEGRDFFGPPFISLTCDLPTAGRYAISIEAVKGPEGGQVQLFRNESPVGEPVDLFADEQINSEPLPMGALDLNEGQNHLMFKIVGKSEKSKALGFDLIHMICEKQ